jgi:hypothetical protein
MPGDSRRNVGAANPRALAELRAGRKIDWSAEDAKKTLSQLLDTKYEELFDPKYASPNICRCTTRFQPPTLLR